MKKEICVRIESIIINVTLGWTVFMALLYFVILFSVPLFQVIAFLPFTEHICNLLTTLFLCGIWAVPVLWLISVILMIFARKKEKQDKRSKAIYILTAALPVLVAVFMLLTNFIDVIS